MNVLGKKLLGGFVAALIGYIWGWSWGWSLFDPSLDVWALLAGIGALVGLVSGLLGLFWRRSAELLCATIGLYLGWVLRTWIFGDKLGGWGVLLMAVTALVGLWVARLYHLQQKPESIIVLLNVLIIGFFGGFIVDMLIGLVYDMQRPHTILAQALLVIGCGLLGGWLSARRIRQSDLVRTS
jgi:hypothetical protein